MAAIRSNILHNDTDRDRFIQACIALKRESSGVSTADIGISSGPIATSSPLSTWDLFVIWHLWSMQEISSDGRRNAAHMGPVFLPWHRWFLLLLEFQMQRVLGLGPDDFGMPYWDWAEDGGDLTLTQQRRTAPIWDVVGGDGDTAAGEIVDGPFTGDDFPVLVEQGPNGNARATNRGLRRALGVSTQRLPRSSEVNAALADGVYDLDDWDSSTLSFRNRVEGWVPRNDAPLTHNKVHVFVGGDMLPGSSPNDPLFFLNHCNVDRLWAQWQEDNPQSPYRPPGRSAQGDPLFRHRELDPLHSILTSTQPSVAAMLDVSDFYVYQ